MKIAFLIAFSGTKFFIAVPAVVLAGYTFWQTVLITSFGGTLGFFIFYYIGELKWVRYYLGRLIDWILGIFGISLETREKKVFTKKTRFIVRVKGRYGLVGIALLTPCLFSIPLGSLILARYFDKNRATIPVMLISIVAWSIGISAFYTLF